MLPCLESNTRLIQQNTIFLQRGDKSYNKLQAIRLRVIEGLKVKIPKYYSQDCKQQ